MASASAASSWMSGRRPSTAGFEWVTQSPSSAEVQRLQAHFPEVIKVPVDELEAEVADWVQKAAIVRSFNRWLPADAFIREFRRARVSGAIAPVSLAFRCHVFRFDSKEDRDLILQRPWVINGLVVGAEAWRPEFSPAEDSVTSVMVWIRLPQLPLEYWKEEFLRAIVEPAGEFVCMDAATSARSRGGFARVCIRVDLRRPLRPGTRIQGCSQPFWQCFVFENLEGLCFKCGTLHLEGQCAFPGVAEEGSSVPGPVFGPWMLAVRKRKAVLDPLLVEKGKAPMRSSSSVPASGSSPQLGRVGSSSGSGSLAEGWVTPVKSARRKSSVSSKKILNSAAVVVVPSEKKGPNATVECSVPVSSECAGFKATGLNLKSKVQLEALKPGLFHSIEHSNPFSSLALDGSADGFMASKKASPGPLKRARPEVPPPPRGFSKLDKKKGKGKAPGSKKGETSCLILGQLDQGPGFQFGAQEVVGTQSVEGESPPLDASTVDHVELGQAALIQGQPDSMEESDPAPDSQWVNPVLVPDEDSQLNGGPVDSVMMEDQGGIPSSSTL